MEKRFQSYEEFWPYYVAQHRHPVNRRLHVLGSTLFLACGVLGVLVSPVWLLVMPVAGYGFAWIGHFFFERNKPATFTHPLWSFRGDARMYRLTWLGRMEPEIRRSSERFPTGA
jgi:hypothetical protein